MTYSFAVLAQKSRFLSWLWMRISLSEGYAGWCCWGPVWWRCWDGEDGESVVWCGVVWQAGCKLAGGEGMRGIAGTIYRSNIQLDPHTPAYTFFYTEHRLWLFSLNNWRPPQKPEWDTSGNQNTWKKQTLIQTFTTWVSLISDHTYIQLSTYKISAMQSVSQMICVILPKYFQLNFPIGAPPPLSNYFLSQSTSQAGQASTIQSWAGQGGTRQRQAGERGGGTFQRQPYSAAEHLEKWRLVKRRRDGWEVRYPLCCGPLFSHEAVLRVRLRCVTYYLCQNYP